MPTDIVVLENSDLTDIVGLEALPSFSPSVVFTALFTSVLALFRSRCALQLEILALRHQLGVLQRSVKRPKLTPSDRLLWATLATVWLTSFGPKTECLYAPQINCGSRKSGFG